jgi:hypothetical protein
VDAERRRLDRESAAGDPDARARLLVARLRAGDLTRERLTLAAMLGDPAARAALAPEAPPEEVGTAMGALLALKPFGPSAFARAALALAPWLHDHQITPLRSVLAWLRAPGSTAPPNVPGWDLTQVGPVVALARTVVRQRDGQTRTTRDDVDASVRAAVVSALVPWALGEGDPMAERDLPPRRRTFVPTERFAVGERIRHPRFGPGEVVRVSASRIVVRFVGGTERTLKLKPSP